MPRDFIFNSLEIRRFRCFHELRIGHLGRVNLIVGKNNVGKSTLLEALRLYARPASLDERIARTLRRTIPFCAIGPNGLDSYDVGELWDQVALSTLEQDVISALRIISPGVHRVALRAAREKARGNSHSRDMVIRIPFVKVDGFEEPIPLRALGAGINRLFGIILALVDAKDGLLLVDEIENGIHYSVQPDIWRLVFEMTARLNVQVFATTHSYDCIKAFEEAARESEEDGVLVRLACKGDRTLVGEFDERELKIAVEGEIEIR